MSDTSNDDARKDTPKDGAPTAESVEEPTSEPSEVHDSSALAHDEEQQGSSFAGTALKLLLILLVGFGLAVWALPRLAPMLPEGMAKALMPAQIEMQDKLASIEGRLAELEGTNVAADAVAAMEGRLAELQSALDVAQQEAQQARTAAEDAAAAAQSSGVSEEVVAEAGSAADRAAGAADTATTAATEAGRVASSAMRDAASLARRMTGFEAQLAAVSEELTTLGQSLAATPSASGEGSSQEAAAAYAALKTRLDELVAQFAAAEYLTGEDAAGFATQDDLRSTRTALTATIETALSQMPPGADIVTEAELGAATTSLDERLSGLSDRVGDVETRATEAEAAATEAQSRVGVAIKGAELDASVATMLSRLEHGQPFAAVLGKVAALSGSEVPEALAAVAATGTSTIDDLVRGFGSAYQDAVAADIREQSDGGIFGNATARLRSVVAGRPKGAQEGETVEAILSRVEASLVSGDLDAALAEADTLSDPVQAALADWLAAVRARANAVSAAEEYTADLGVSEG